MKGALEPRHRAFTLVELLVVIAIIALLLSILLPVITKARRKAIILASPVVYQTVRDNALHVTDSTLSMDLRITPNYGGFFAYRPAGVMWSPSGQKLGYDLSDWQPGPPNHAQYIVIFNPLTGELLKHPQMPADPQPRSSFAGWVDDGKFIERVHGGIHIRDAGTGAVISTTPIAAFVASGPFYPLPLTAPAPYISVERGGIRLVSRNFRYGKAVWLPADPNNGYPRAATFRVDVDVSGDWVAWTMQTGSADTDRKTAFKRLSDPAVVEPTYISFPGYFVQWTDTGNLLFMHGNGMSILDKSGQVVRSAYIEEGVVTDEASWRRFGHR